MSGFGKCSLTVALPIISVMGAEAHPLPTAVLSNQTGYDSYKAYSLSDEMPLFVDEWKKLGCSFDAILVGYFNDIRQLYTAQHFIEEFKRDNTILIVDPVMADNGSLYDGFTKEMCDKMKSLCLNADVITPNLSELAILADEKPCNTVDDVISCGNKLLSLGVKSIVATGLKKDGIISNIVFENGEVNIVSANEVGGYYSGTGDILASVITGGMVRGMTLLESVRLATEFIEKAVAATEVENHNEGIYFEKYLGDLI